MASMVGKIANRTGMIFDHTMPKSISETSTSAV
jgi:hypothetical protein